jgi:hypothetical protein
MIQVLMALLFGSLCFISHVVCKHWAELHTGEVYKVGLEGKFSTVVEDVIKLEEDAFGEEEGKVNKEDGEDNLKTVGAKQAKKDVGKEGKQHSDGVREQEES